MNKNQYTQTDIWERWGWLWNGIFYMSVLISIALVFTSIQLSDIRLVIVTMSLGLIAWHWIGIRLSYQKLEVWDTQVRPRFTVIVVDIVFWFILVNISPAYYFTLFGLFIMIFRHLPARFATVTASILTILMILEQIIDTGATFDLTNPNNWLLIFAGLASILIGIWISAIIEQSMQRRELIEQLEATRTELAAAERREGILEERQRLAREIHDTLAQGFTSIVMHLEAAEQALPDDLSVLQKHLNRARTTARNSLDQARRVVQDLRPDLLEQQSLPDAIQRTAKRWSDATDIPASTQSTGNIVPIHPHVEVMLLRATQEALNNIRKHAQASEVQITLSYMSDAIMLDIQDDGVGLDGSKASSYSGGYGLQAMRERAEQSGGSVMLESDIGEGTTVTVTVPLSNGLHTQFLATEGTEDNE